MKRFLLAAFAVAAISSSAAAAPIDNLNPPATRAERELYAPIAGNAKEINLFMATRNYVRANPNGEGRMPEEFDFRYLVDIPEQLKYFQIAMAQGFKKIVNS